MAFQVQTGIDEALHDIDNLRKQLKKKKQRQVRADDERALAKATAQAWFNTHKVSLHNGDDISEIDNAFALLLNFSDHNTTRDRYIAELKVLKHLLLEHRTRSLTSAGSLSSSTPPDFSPLVSDPKMRTILERRWRETAVCISGGAHLAATVMMGGLLEALLLACVHQMKNVDDAFKTTACPKDKTGKPVTLKEWTLSHYIGVAHELGWIGDMARDVSAVMRDYRNYVHPYKEFSHGVVLEANDAHLMWVVHQQLVAQLLASKKPEATSTTPEKTAGSSHG